MVVEEVKKIAVRNHRAYHTAKVEVNLSKILNRRIKILQGIVIKYIR